MHWLLVSREPSVVAMFRVLSFLVGALCIDVLVGVAVADPQRSQVWFSSLTYEERRGIQLNLMLTGHYAGTADATFGNMTYNALVLFEKERGSRPNGQLDRVEAQSLVAAAQRALRTFGMAERSDPRAGIVLPIPSSILTRESKTNIGTQWESQNQDIRLETYAFDASDAGISLLYTAKLQTYAHNIVEYSILRDDFFVISGKKGSSKFYTRIQNNGAHFSGFEVNWGPNHESWAPRIAVYLASKATYFRAAPAQSDVSSSPNRPNDGKSGERNSVVMPLSSGTGFFVSATGLLVTNYHVIEGCTSVEVVGHGKGEIVRADENTDLAAVLVSRPSAMQETAILGASPPPLGANVVVGGFPLSDLFNSQFSVAFGSVTGRQGIGGNAGQFAISAPVQPGNSGGPVVDGRGKIVGVVVGKLNDAKMMEVAGTTGANFNFSISVEKLHDFLRPFIVSTRNSTVKAGRDEVIGNEEIAKSIEAYARQIICRR